MLSYAIFHTGYMLYLQSVKVLLQSPHFLDVFLHQWCCGISTATYGNRRPLAGSAGGRRIAQRADQRIAARQRTHKQFTQVWAAARHKTLLLLWWIDGGMEVVKHSTLSRQGLP